MFITSQLNVLHKIIKNQPIPVSILAQLEQTYVNFEATLLRAKVLRDFSKSETVYLIQSHIEPQQSSVAYLFSPFIFGKRSMSVSCLFIKIIKIKQTATRHSVRVPILFRLKSTKFFHDKILNCFQAPAI